MKYCVLPIPALKDNYIWLLQDKLKNRAWIVDPGDARVTIQYIEQEKLILSGILLTHHHWDHSGGISGILKHFGRLPVVGSHLSKIDMVTSPVKQDDEIQCGSFNFKIMEIPGHTKDHIAFYGHNALFCGDTLFSAGCGKLFEGTGAEMYGSINKIASLPDETLIFCGHEYTMSNLNFAALVDPQNNAIKEKIKKIKQNETSRRTTLPSKLREEKQFNPFLRCTQPEIISAVEKHAKKKLSDPVEVFTHLREWKNHFVL